MHCLGFSIIRDWNYTVRRGHDTGPLSVRTLHRISVERLSWVLLVGSFQAMVSVMFIWIPSESSFDHYGQRQLTRNLCLVIFLAVVRIFGLVYLTSGILFFVVMDNTNPLLQHQQQQAKTLSLEFKDLDSGGLLMLGMFAVRTVGPMLGGWLVAFCFFLLKNRDAQ